MSLHLPTVIAGWTLLKLMGEGAMGQVWKVHRITGAGGSVLAVMKLPLAGGVADPKAGHRWLGEAQILMKLQTCSHVVKVYDAGIDRGIYYIVMEYVHGTDLAKLLRLMRKSERALPIAGALWIGGQAMLGLAEIHGVVIANVAQKILHKDVAPKNTLVSVNGEVRLSDFGISTARDVEMTNAGTLRYIAVEQHEGRPTPRSDVYSNAVVIWELLEMAPYRSGDAERVRRAIFAAQPRPLTRPGVDPRVSSLLMSALDPREPERPTAMEFVEALEATGCYVPHERLVGGFVRTLASGVATSGQTELIECKQLERTPNLVGLLAARDEQLARGELDTARVLAAAQRRASDEHAAIDAVTVLEPGGALERRGPASPLPPAPLRMPRTLPLPPTSADAPPSGRTALVFAPEPGTASRTNPLPRELRGVPLGTVPEPRSWVMPAIAEVDAACTGETAPQHEAVTTSAVVVTLPQVARPLWMASAVASALLAATLGGYGLLAWLEPPVVPSSLSRWTRRVIAVVPTTPEPQLEPVLDAAPAAVPAATPVAMPNATPVAMRETPVVAAPAVAKARRPTQLERVRVTFYRDFIDGFDVKIGRRSFIVTTDHSVEIAAGRHRVRWMEHGTDVWKDAGTIAFTAGKQHVVRVGAIGQHGFQHRAIAGRP